MYYTGDGAGHKVHSSFVLHREWTRSHTHKKTPLYCTGNGPGHKVHSSVVLHREWTRSQSTLLNCTAQGIDMSQSTLLNCTAQGMNQVTNYTPPFSLLLKGDLLQLLEVLFSYIYIV